MRWRRTPTSHSFEARLGILFMQATDLPRPQREAFVAEACGTDRDLHDELSSLIEAHEAAGAYFDDMAERVVEPALAAMSRADDAADDSSWMERLQGALAETYRFERELGGGGMSHVLVAEDLRLRRHVVIKVVSPAMIPTEAAERFQREIEVAAQLQHPHIVPLLAAEVIDGVSYYTMPFVTGESLKDRLARAGPLPTEDALRIWRDVLDALAYAHAHGVVHRDIKPGNILLGGRHALVTDFGIALALKTAAGEVETHAEEQVIGTPAYMAPEQASGGSASDPRVDIYQAGLLMYEMLSGGLPFRVGTPRELLQARVAEEPMPLRAPEAPAALAALVMRCLARAPDERPACAEAVLAELEAITETPTVAGSGAWAARSVDTRVKRSAAALLVLLLVAAGGLAWGDGPRAFAGRSEVSTPAATASHHTPEIAAYEWYRRGMDVALLRSDAGVRQGITYFERAVAIDSLYAPAYAGLARMYVHILNSAPSGEKRAWSELAEAAALHAVRLDANDAEAHGALGWVLAFTGRYREAEAALERAIALDPNVPRGHEGLARVYMMTGRPAAQLAEARLGVASDPFSHSAIRELALALATNDRCEDALGQLRPLKELSPPAAVAGVIAGMCYATRERWPEAIAEFEWASAAGDARSPRALLGYALARAGRSAEAEQVLSDLLAGREDSHGAFGIATVYAGMRDFDQAFAWLDRAVDEGSVTSYIMHPIFADLRRDSRFGPVLQRMGVSGG